MIQISMVPTQPSVQPQQSQQTAPEQETSFQSVLQKASAATAGGKDGKAVSEQQEPGEGKTSEQSEQKADLTNVQVSAVNLSLLAAVVQQLQQPQSVQAAAETTTTISVKEVDGVAAQAAGTPQMAPGTPNAENPASTVLPTAASPVQQNQVQTAAPVIIPVDTQTASVPLEQPAVQTVTPVLESESSAIPLVSQDAVQPQQAQNPAVQQLPAPVQTESALPAVQLNPADVSSDANLNSDSQPQNTVALPVKQSTVTDETVLSSQPPVSFSDLMQTGNVIIKISDAPQTAPKAAVHQVADKISLNYKAGNPKFEMDLFPKNLGKVTVKMAMENGTLTVEIAAANPKTQSMLLSNAGGIRSMIETTVNHPVQVTQPSQSSQDKQWYQQGQEQSHSQQQQERQQRESSGYRANDDDSGLGMDDFLTVMQQLRVKAYSV